MKTFKVKIVDCWGYMFSEEINGKTFNATLHGTGCKITTEELVKQGIECNEEEGEFLFGEWPFVGSEFERVGEEV